MPCAAKNAVARTCSRECGAGRCHSIRCCGSAVRLADALAHAHDRGVVHRDVKPSNIILDREGLPHLTDFGIALLADTPRLTGANEILGTPAYLAPEQLSDAAVGPPADVYALGLVLLECLSGELEYALGSSLDVALARLNRPPRTPTGVPPEVADLLTVMTATEALDRPTAEACALRLQAAADDTRHDVAPPKPVSLSAVAAEPVVCRADEDSTAHIPAEQATSTHSRRRRRLQAASVAGIAAMVAVGLIFLLNTPQPLAGGSQATATGHASSGPSAADSTNRARATGGAGTPGSVSSVGMLVVNDDQAPATTPPAPASSTARTSRTSHPTPTTTPPPTTPRQTTVSTQPPPSTSSEPPAATSTSTEPPSTTGNETSGVSGH